MLALSPPSFSTNIAYWPLEDTLGHDDQNYFYRDVEPANSDQSVFLNSFPMTLVTSDQRSRAELDWLASPTTTTGAISRDLSMAVRKLNHNVSERDRRKKINHLYSSLRALLPASDHTKKLSIPATVSRVVKYIPELQQEVEGLIRKREELLSITNSRQLQVGQEIKNQIKSISRTSLSSVSASQLNNKDVAVQISTLKADKNYTLSEILHNLEEDGLSVLNISSFESSCGRVFHNLHLQMSKLMRKIKRYSESEDVDGVVRTLTNVRHVFQLRRSLISLEALDTLGCEYYAKSGFMQVNRGDLVAIKGEKVKNLYKLIGTTVVGGAIKEELCQEESSSVMKEVVGVKWCNKMWIIVEDNKDKMVKTCGSEDALKKKKTIPHVKFDKSLNLAHVYSC
ncbi:Transcription factor ORG2 [Morus notabilis]|uniref:Transcription factor ORG2 n=1 Tax=Morus notabilis TaxID=981085 RepID=W9SP46_9ROSA|nr:transcription factor ORG2 [Morus notabilis]EXC19631.1 Transcription factor ORG2 [Morus notabilis]